MKVQKKWVEKVFFFEVGGGGVRVHDARRNARELRLKMSEQEQTKQVSAKEESNAASPVAKKATVEAPAVEDKHRSYALIEDDDEPQTHEEQTIKAVW